MIKVYKISAIMFALIILCAPSCEDEQEMAKHEEAVLEATKNDIRSEFETDYLTESALFAYETAAKQKLSDFADYLHIMIDTSLDMSFRVKASEMLKNIFQSENVRLRLALFENDPDKELDILHINEIGLNNELSTLPFSFDSIYIHEPLQRNGNTSYSGTFKFLQNFKYPDQSTQLLKYFTRTADIYVVKEHKVFGMDTLNVWNVQLGKIK